VGHIRLGVLPKYPKWKVVISLLDDQQSTASQVADKVLDNSRGVLQSESAQDSVSYCVWLMAQLTLASRTEKFADALATLGIAATTNTSVTEFLALTARVASRQLGRLTPQSAINSIANHALRETLTRTIGASATTLFGANLSDAQVALKQYSTDKQFSNLLHVFFTAFLSRTLRYVLDKEIANHLGPSRRFGSVTDLEQFEMALEGFAGQTSRIVDTFSGGWYSKKMWQRGAISEVDARGFAHVALNKLSADLSLNEM